MSMYFLTTLLILGLDIIPSSGSPGRIALGDCFKETRSRKSVAGQSAPSVDVMYQGEPLTKDDETAIDQAITLLKVMEEVGGILAIGPKSSKKPSKWLVDVQGKGNFCRETIWHEDEVATTFPGYYEFDEGGYHFKGEGPVSVHIR